MGVRDYLRRKFSSAAARRAEEAADQIYQQLLMGRTIEIPAVHSTDADITQAILRLREKYKERVFVNMLQTKGIVITRGVQGKLAVSSDAFAKLDAAGYFPDAALPPEAFFEMHREFQRRNDVDPEKADREVREQLAKDNAVEVKGTTA